MKFINLMVACLLFTFYANPIMAAPVITSVHPSHGPIAGGNVITIHGSGFTAASAVDFGLRAAVSYTVNNDHSISAVVPAGTAGTVDVTVAAASHTSATSREDFYTYNEISWSGIISGTEQNAITLFETATNTVTSTILLPAESLAAIITPDGTTIYAADSDNAEVNVIDAATNTIIDNIPTPVAGIGAFDMIVSPDGKRVYVSNLTSGYVTVIDTTTNTVAVDIFVATGLGPLSITPDGKTVYVSNFFNGNVTAIDTATNTVRVSISTGSTPGMIAITPDGITAYVANSGSDTISVINVATNVVTSTITFPAGSGPYGSFILPIGHTMYVANINNATVSVVDLATNSIVDTIPVLAGSQPFWVVATPDSKTIYVINEAANNVTPIDVATNTVGASFANISGDVEDIVMSPDQAPVASFTVSIHSAGHLSHFDASASISPVGTITNYAWDFGDSMTLNTSSPIASHKYTTSSSFNVTLTVTNSAGTSTTKVFSSRFMSNNGGPTATVSQTLDVPPGQPTCVKGFQKVCSCEVTNVIKWHPPHTGDLPVSYKIYGNAALTDLIAVIPGNGNLIFEDPNVKKHKTYKYYLVSVGSTGILSAPVHVVITPH